MHGLHADPQLKQKIINALKTSPGSPIWVNGICIYRGYEKHFDQFDEPRGRPFEQPHGRRRSRSPKDESSRRPRSRSPIRRRSLSPLRRPSAPMPELQRLERSPIRRYHTPGPQRARTPTRQENQKAPSVERIRFQVPPKPTVPQSALLQGVNNKNNDPAPRQPLGQITNNAAGNNVSTSDSNTSTPTRSADQERPSDSGPKPIQPITLPSDDEPEVDDPWFVLGIGRGALIAE